MSNKTNLYPRWRWCTTLECTVEVLKQGHFPTTYIVKLPDGRTTEIDEDKLTVPPQA